MINNRDITIFPAANALFQFAAQDFAKRTIATVNHTGKFSVALSGGSTPTAFFDILTHDDYFKKNIPWRKIKFFFSDERYVPFDNAQSNYHMAYEHLFSKLPIDPDNIYRIPTEFKDPDDSALSYTKTLRKVFSIDENTLPKFDLVYLGLGDDAHTASLMPLTDLVKQYAENISLGNQLAAALFVPELKMSRITLTPTIINNSSNIIFLVTGESKADAVWEVLEGPTNPIHYPAQLIQCKKGKVMWYLDHDAASKLSK